MHLRLDLVISLDLRGCANVTMKCLLVIYVCVGNIVFLINTSLLVANLKLRAFIDD